MEESSRNNKRIAKNTILLYFRMLMTMGVSLYTSRIVLINLGVVDFGIYSVIGGLVSMFVILNGTLASGTQRFLTYAIGSNNSEDRNKTFSASLNIHISIAIVIFILAQTIGLWFLKNKINIPVGREYAALCVYQFSILTAIVSIIQVPYNSIIIAYEKMNVYAYLSIIDVSLKLMVTYFLIVASSDKLILYSILIFICNLLIMSVYTTYTRKRYSECRFRLITDVSLYKSMLTFSGWNIIGAGAAAGVTQGINILLNLFFNPLINAARGISVQVNYAILGFINNFQTAVNPQIVKLYAAEKIEELHSLLFNNAKFSFCIMWCLLLPLLLKVDVVLSIWLVEVPEYTALFCRLILLQSLVSCIQRPFVMAIYATGRTKIVNLTSGLISLSVLPISYFILKGGGAVYLPFIIQIGANIIGLIIEVSLLVKWIKLSPSRYLHDTLRPIILIVLSTLPIAYVINIHSTDNILSLIYISIISVFLVLLSTYYIALDKEIRLKIINKIRSIIHL